MSPLLLLVDHSQLLNRVNTLYSFAPGEETAEATVARETNAGKDHRNTQLKSLLVGTLMFVPFLAAYVALCASK
ncbi:hypothetical protein [Paraburkholderia acidisoli]|uniref:Uncharacterized protein n=1 Tax=Paraburkholderia acidisoli TaxID=2571748 RepID=A0A7Z2GNG2_9BURK|nr:hypothetical protein [Paraburkholderia acidisoli]QGZ65025.1 hypothetical protein FAZ98_24855 [Paraburkholderia acidisoli]